MRFFELSFYFLPLLLQSLTVSVEILYRNQQLVVIRFLNFQAIQIVGYGHFQDVLAWLEFVPCDIYGFKCSRGVKHLIQGERRESWHAACLS